MFGATLVVTGTVSHNPRGGIHMIVNLVDAKNMQQLRSPNFDVNSDDPAEMQRSILNRVAEVLQLEVQPDNAKKVAQAMPSSPAAYDYYLKGLGYLAGRDGQDNAIIEFKLALKEDAKYALGRAGLCEAYWYKYEATRDKSWVPQAGEQCKLAIDLNPRIARPHLALAILDSGTGKYDEAAAHARTAIEIDPRNDQAYAELATALSGLGQDKQAEATVVRATEMRPNDALNQNRLASFLFIRGRYSRRPPTTIAECWP